MFYLDSDDGVFLITCLLVALEEHDGLPTL